MRAAGGSGAIEGSPETSRAPADTRNTAAGSPLIPIATGWPIWHRRRIAARSVGARITVELSDGSSRSCEVFAGSGYYSQSSPECFFGYPDGNPPRRISVRWLSGATTEHAYPPGAATLVLPATAP